MKRRERPGVVDLGRYRTASSKKPPKSNAGPEPGPWLSWGVLLAAAVAWAALRMVTAG